AIEGCIDFGTSYYVLASLSGGEGNDTYNVVANGAAPVEVNADASVVLGPFAQGVTANVIVVGIQDEDCGVTASAASPVACPPVNENCDGAIALDCNAGPMTFSSAGSTAVAPSGCTIGPKGIWFSFVGTGADITVNSSANFDNKI